MELFCVGSERSVLKALTWSTVTLTTDLNHRRVRGLEPVLPERTPRFKDDVFGFHYHEGGRQ